MVTPSGYIKETVDELRKVIWPSRQEIIRLTIIVLLISFLVGVYIGGLDYLFTTLFGLIVKR